MKTEDTIRLQIQNNPILLYMKGSPAKPECGFSANAVSALQSTGVDFAFVNVLENPFIREKLPSISHWPTFPQLFVDGELIGGADIVADMAREGTLEPLLQKATADQARA